LAISCFAFVVFLICLLWGVIWWGIHQLHED
jgi:hypothetical protein